MNANLGSCSGQLEWEVTGPYEGSSGVLVTIQAPDGSQVFAETAYLYTDSDQISGTYTACSPGSTGTTTVTFTSPTQPYMPVYYGYVDYEILEPDQCSASALGCYYQFAVDWGLSSGGVDGASDSDQMFDFNFPNCNATLSYNFILDTPVSVSNLIFSLEDTSGNVVYQVNMAAENSTSVSGTFQPSCSSGASSGTTNDPVLSPNYGISGIDIGIVVLVLGFVVELSGVGLRQLRRQRSSQRRVPEPGL